MVVAILSDISVLFLLAVVNAFFAGAEMAVVAVRKTRLRELADQGRSGARAVLALRESPERFLATVQIGVTVVGATAAAFGGHSIAAQIAPLFGRVWPAHAEELSLAVVIAGVSYLSIVVGELVPKSLALRSAERYALLVGRFLLAISSLARPLVWLLTASSNAVLRIFGKRTTFTESRHSAEELQELVDEATRAGTVHPGAGEIASRALEFPMLDAKDVMVPRGEVVMLPRHAPPEEVRRVLLESRHTRLPVYEGRIDNIIGYLNVKDVLLLAWDQKLFVLEDVTRPPYFVPESKSAVELLQDMRQRHTPFAIVVDEQGSMSGIVTMEDLIEELVGDIFSENTRSELEAVQRQPDGTALVAGSTPVREVNRAMGLELPEEGNFSTLAGLCLAIAGRIPAIGDTITLPDGIALEVVDATPRRVRVIRVRPPPAPHLDDGSTAPLPPAT